jgi:serine protease Do
MRRALNIFFLSFVLFLGIWIGRNARSGVNITLPAGAPKTAPAPGTGVEGIVELIQPSVVTIALSAEVPDLLEGTRVVNGNVGSGFVLSRDGYIATNRHVISVPNANYTVIINDRQYPVQQVFSDPTRDIAVIKIDADQLTPMTLGNSEALKLGESVIAIGTTLGEFSNSVTTGVISGLGRSIIAGSRGATEELENLIQTDAAINPGNSGGPLLNLQGEAIGINTAVAAEAQNIGFAIPINELKEFATGNRFGI